MQYFFDTSAAVKLYHQETGSDRVFPLYRDGEAIVISEFSKVEFLIYCSQKVQNRRYSRTNAGGSQ